VDDVRFALLMFGNEPAEAALPEAERDAIVAGQVAMARRMAQAGVLVHGEPLGPAQGASIVWLDGEPSNGEPTVEDEPLLEGPRQMGGFYVIDVTDREDALRWATEIPRSPGLVVEVRSIPEV
jgi:hypothetical protein